MPYQRNSILNQIVFLSPSSFLLPPPTSNKTIISTVTTWYFVTHWHPEYFKLSFNFMNPFFPFYYSFSLFSSYLPSVWKSVCNVSLTWFLLYSSNKSNGFWTKYKYIYYPLDMQYLSKGWDKELRYSIRYIMWTYFPV